MANPGSIVNTGSLMTPGGDQGSPAYTVTLSSFTVPAVGSTVTVTVNDTSWISPGQFLWIANAKSAGVAGTLQIQSISGNTVTLLNPTTGANATAGSTVSTGSLVSPGASTGPSAVSANAGNAATLGSDSLIYVPDSGIASVISQRTRGFNAVGNPNFEVDQRNTHSGAALGAGAASAWMADRWLASKTGGSGTANVISNVGASGINAPGTSFPISQGYGVVQLTTAQASLAAGDILYVYQTVEGPQLRELLGDVHSISLLVSSTVAGLKFGVSIRDVAATRSLVKLCTIPTANTWTLIPLAILPIWASGATWSVAPGVGGYLLSVCLAAGSTYTAPANDTWQNGNFVGAAGQSNFFASPVNASFSIGFIQHEPGPLCTSLIDKPFDQNLHECLRYYTKSYDYGTKAGTVTGGSYGAVGGVEPAATHPWYPVRFPRPMAKTPTIALYSTQTGAANAVYDSNNATDRSVTSINAPSTGGYIGGTLSTTASAATMYYWQHVADTGW